MRRPAIPALLAFGLPAALASCSWSDAAATLERLPVEIAASACRAVGGCSTRCADGSIAGSSFRSACGAASAPYRRSAL